MDYYAGILIIVVFKWGLQQYLNKKIGAKEFSRTRKLRFQYIILATLALILFLLTDEWKGNLNFIGMGLIILLGIFNAFATYSYWRAQAISMFKTSILSNLDDLIALSTGYIFLGEISFLTPKLIIGTIISATSAIFFVLSRQKKDERVGGGHLIPWVIFYSVIWGLYLFSMRAFSLAGMGRFTYTVAWYLGSFIGSIITMLIMGKKEKGNPLTLNQMLGVSVLASVVLANALFGYWFREQYPITSIQPIELPAEMILPAIIGLIFFNESKEMKKISRKEIISILFAVIGVLLIIVGFK